MASLCAFVSVAQAHRGPAGVVQVRINEDDVVVLLKFRAPLLLAAITGGGEVGHEHGHGGARGHDDERRGVADVAFLESPEARNRIFDLLLETHVVTTARSRCERDRVEKFALTPSREWFDVVARYRCASPMRSVAVEVNTLLREGGHHLSAEFMAVGGFKRRVRLNRNASRFTYRFDEQGRLQPAQSRVGPPRGVAAPPPSPSPSSSDERMDDPGGDDAREVAVGEGRHEASGEGQGARVAAEAVSPAPAGGDDEAWVEDEVDVVAPGNGVGWLWWGHPALWLLTPLLVLGVVGSRGARVLGFALSFGLAVLLFGASWGLGVAPLPVFVELAGLSALGLLAVSQGLRSEPLKTPGLLFCLVAGVGQGAALARDGHDLGLLLGPGRIPVWVWFGMGACALASACLGAAMGEVEDGESAAARRWRAGVGWVALVVVTFEALGVLASLIQR